MSEMTRVKDVVETVITDDDVSRISNRVDTDVINGISKATMKAFRRAKKAGDAESKRAREIVSALRAKREGVVGANKTITKDTPPTNTPSMGGQASIFDFA